MFSARLPFLTASNRRSKACRSRSHRWRLSVAAACRSRSWASRSSHSPSWHPPSSHRRGLGAARRMMICFVRQTSRPSRWYTRAVWRISKSAAKVGSSRSFLTVYTPQSGQRWPAVAGASRGIDGLLATGPGVAGLGQGFVMAVPVLCRRAPG